MIKKVCKYLINKQYRFYVNNTRKIYKYKNDKKFLKLFFLMAFNKKLNLENPITYQEKVQWLKLNDRKQIYTVMADKLQMKAYVSKIIGEQYVVPIIKVWNSVDDIDFSQLPKKYVLKCNHNSGRGMYICKDCNDINIAAIKRELKKGIKENYYIYYREWPYKNIERKVFAEEYLEKKDGSEIIEYKVLCFEGQAKLVKLIRNRFTEHPTQDFYTAHWEKTEIYESDIPKSEDIVPPPKKLEEIITLSEKIADNMHHLRVDWYDVDGRIYVGELTFFDGAGFSEFLPKKYNEIIGSWIKLNREEK